MTDITKKLGFGSQEQQVSPEEKQLLVPYASVANSSLVNRLRIVVWQENPDIIYEEDNIPKPGSTVVAPESPTAGVYDPTQATNNVVYLANRSGQEEWTEQQRMAEDARRRARQEAA